jgi:outer membrane protein TolC
MKLTLTTRVLFPAVLASLCVCSPAAAAQNAPEAVGGDVQLTDLYRAAVDNDPRLRELQLQADQTGLRLRNIETERLPSIVAEGQAQYQSDVPTSPFLGPGGQPVFSAPKETLDAHLRIDQRLFDPTIAPRLAAERAQLAESNAQVHTTLFGVRQEVNDAFFAAALLQERRRAIAAALSDLEGRLREMQTRVREGTAIPAEAAAIEAALLQRQQDDAELATSRRAALARLSRLTGLTFDADVRLAVPVLAARVEEARANVDATRARPEYEQFAKVRERLARQQDVAAAQDQPKLSAFARVGYGRPGLNFISTQGEPYGLAGVQVQWKAWTWGATDRERQALTLQQQIVAADEAAFTRGIGRSSETDLAAIDRLATTLALDDRIIPLREEIARSMGVRFEERVATAAEYLDRTTELLEARLARAGHVVELAQASARFLTTLGLEVR